MTSLARGLAIRGISLVTKPTFWVGVNAFSEAEDAAAYIRGEDMSWQLGHKWRPVVGPHPMFGPVMVPLPFPYLDFTKSPSTGGGGPGELPNLHQSPPSIEETGKIISTPPMAGDVPSSPAPKYVTPYFRDGKPTRCPPGYHLTKKRYRKGGPLTWVCIRKRRKG